VSGPNAYRLSVVAHDRPGLLADTASILASEHVHIESASVMTWSDRELALHALTVQSDTAITQRRWTEIGSRLRGLGTGTPVATPYLPSGRVRAIRTGAGDGTSVVRVTAPDRLGILGAIARWFADHDVSVEAANVATIDGQVQDVFLVRGSFEVEELSRSLSAAEPCGLFDMTFKMTEDMIRSALRFAGCAPG
jgi:[protein-PII] uridylyltransferase